MDKKKWLDVAEVADAHRIIPKILVFVTLGAYMLLCYVMIGWSMDIYGDLKDIPTSIAALIGTLLTTMGAIPTMVVRKYLDGGRKWKDSDKSED